MTDTIKTTAIATIGFITQLTQVDIILKVLIGVGTLIYLGMKIYDWIEGRIKSRRTKPETVPAANQDIDDIAP